MAENSYMGSDRIELTPEMIKAGALAFGSYDSRVESAEEIAEQIFWAMWDACGVSQVDT